MQIGLFGKLPAHGDFIARGLSTQMRKTLDRWVTQFIGQNTVPDGGLRARCVLSGQHCCLVVARSHDRSGRIFPIVAIAPDEGQGQPDWNDWGDRAYDVLQHATTQTHDAQSTFIALPAAPQTQTHALPAQSIMWGQAGDPMPLSDAIATLMAQDN